MSERPLLACLLPVRNGAADLPGYLESAARFADVVVALDDGSTDETRELLEASPLVATVLANPRREGYEGWDDAANRGRLLEAAAELSARWILSLDVDERFDAADGRALRRFVGEEALPGFAFGFAVYRMVGAETFEPAGWWVYRLFSHEPGQQFPERRLHFDPVPTSIPRSRWLRTTLRIQHLAGLTPERREERIAKYRAVDPQQSYGYAYADATADPRGAETWQPRSPDLRVLLPGRPSAAAEEPPALSAIVISRDDEARIERAVRSVVTQESPWPFEVIVVTSGRDRTAEIVRREFPAVTLVELAEPALPGEARNAGLRHARGDYVSFPGSHVELPPGSLAARIRAHDQGYAMVTGTTLNGTDTPAGWANYFLDHAEVLPGRPTTELSGPPAHCSYRRDLLLEAGGFPEGIRAGEDTLVNHELARRGHRALRAQDVTLVHHTPCRTVPRLLRHHFTRGRSFGRILLRGHRQRGGLLAARTPASLFRMQVTGRLRRTDAHVTAWGGEELGRRYAEVRRLVAAGALAHFAGTCVELVRLRRGTPFVLVGRPVVTVGAPDGSVLRIDAVARRAKVLRPGESVPVDGRVGLDADTLRRRLPRLTAIAAVARAPELPRAAAVTLLWGLLTIPRHDVHLLAAAGGASAERLLDTRDRRERRGASGTAAAVERSEVPAA